MSPDLPEFRVAAPVRCYQPDASPSKLGICGELAQFARTDERGVMGFFCASHSRPGDRPIPEAPRIRRVSVVVEVVFTAASWVPETAKAEALERLARAVESAGGVLSLQTATSVMGRYVGSVALARATTGGHVG